MKLLLIFSMLLSTYWSTAQASHDPVDSIHRKRTIITSSALGITWSASMVGLYQIWFKDDLQKKFNFENDAHLWLQMDKAGHAYTSWMIGQFTGNLYKSCGFDTKRSALLGGAIGLGYQTTLEVFDGFSQGYGFSWSDMVANTVGTMLYTSQELVFSEQILKLKFSYSPSPYANYRPEVLGNTHLTRLFKDYNGQTYWVSFSPASFAPNLKIPNWLCLSLGYSTDQKLKGDEKYYSTFSSSGEVVNFEARREFLLSLDIDLSKIPVRKTWLKKTLEQINLLKIPMPALRFNNGVTYGHWLYF